MSQKYKYYLKHLIKSKNKNIAVIKNGCVKPKDYTHPFQIHIK